MCCWDLASLYLNARRVPHGLYRAHKRRPSDQAGFTLLELLVVLLIVAFASVIALGFDWHHSDAAELKSAALTLASDLRRARSSAITRNAITVVELDVEHHRYLRPWTGTFQAFPHDIEVTAAVQGDTTPQQTGLVALRFWPDGTAASADLTLTLHGQHAHITLDWLTGHVATSP
jgi:general secretion pathway protein H